MSITSRTARTVRIVGVTSVGAALALGVAGNAFACSIGDFSAVASCDSNGKGVITVSDTDASRQTATVSVYLESNGADAKQVGVQTVKGTKKGATVSFPEDWTPKAQYRVRVTVAGILDTDLKAPLFAPDKACQTSETTPPASGTPKPSATPSSSSAPSATPSESGSTAPAAAGSNFPSPAAGTSNLAETGAGSSTPMIAGIAGGLVLIGGGAVFFGMRRRGASKNG
ncbi:LAETG motif-containing sortase-dependent surface protein [Streptomyces sp. NPDC047022]|uniref:LAETG motif-containing sortase-dependent surface protein n=1 Tax=Streptomyces sp. NPDC047022 TaxID=3155737 RepID=UPI0033F8CC3D